MFFSYSELQRLKQGAPVPVFCRHGREKLIFYPLSTGVRVSQTFFKPLNGNNLPFLKLF